MKRKFLTLVAIVICIFQFSGCLGTEVKTSEADESKDDKIVEQQIADASDFDSIGFCDNLGQIVVEKGGKFGIVKNGGLIILEPKYDWISSLPCNNGMRKFKNEGLYGVLDIDGNVILEPKYEYISIDEFQDTIEIREGLTYTTYKLEEIVKI